MPNPVIRFRIDFSQDSNVGPGKIELLEAIQSSGSLSQAARDIGMSYRRAWQLMESLNAAFMEPLTIASVGGKGGGGVQITKFGAILMKSYRALEADIAKTAANHLHAVIPNVAGSRAAKSKAPRRPLARKSKAQHWSKTQR